MNEIFFRLDALTKEVLELEVDGRKLKEQFEYKGQDFSFFYRERLRNHLYEFYDPWHRASNFIPRGRVFRYSVWWWKRIQPFLIREKKNHYSYLFFERPWFTKVEKGRIKSEFYDSIINNLPLGESLLVVDLSPKEWLKFLFLGKKNKNVANFWSYYQKCDPRFLAHLQKINKKIQKNENITALALTAQVEPKLVYRVSEQILSYYLPNLLLYQETVNHLLDLHQPKKATTIMLSEEVRVTNLSAHQRGMSTFWLPHGRLSERAFFLLQEMATPESLPNYLVLGSEEEKKLSFSFVIKPKILILGNPKYDLLKSFTLDKEKFYQKHRIPHNKKIIFWPTQSHCMFKEEVEKNTLSLMKFLQENLDYFLIIKFHPRENQKESFRYHRHYAEKYSIKNIKILKFDEEDTTSCIFVADVVVTKASSVGIESILLNRPVINFELMKIISLGIFESEGIGLIAHSPEELEKYLHLVYTPEFKSTFQKKRKEFISKFFNNFGSAGKVVAHFMRK